MIKPTIGFRNKVVSRTISILLLQTFLFYNTSFASLDKTPQTLTKDVKFQKASIDDIGISKDIGSIKTKFKGKDSKLLIHIQDAHCNYEAQTNISKILESLSKDYNINVISVEGADGFIDTAWFKSFPDAEIRREVADYFMKKGEITGAEFLSITKDYPVKLYGAEDRDLYIKNLNAFTQVYPHKQEIERYLLNIKAVLGRLKTYIYSKEITAFDNVTEEYKDKKKTLSDYAKILSVQLKRHNLDLKAYPDFSKLVYTLVYEDRIDFKVVDQERANLIDALSKAVSKEKLQEMIVKSFSFKTGRVTAAEYYEYLKNLVIANNIEFLTLYPNLSNYVIYTKLYDKINTEHLFDEIDRIKVAIKDKLFENDDQRNLSDAWDNVNILIGFINIKLSNKEYDYYKARHDKFKIGFFADFIKSKVRQYNLACDIDEPTEAVKSNLPQLEAFYETASKRDRVLVENTIDSMKKEKADAAVLITGGFHTTGISRILEDKGISYIVVCPAITKDVESPYIQVLTNQKTPFEELLTESAAPTKKDSLLAPYSLARRIMMRMNGERGALKALQEAVTRAGGETEPASEMARWAAFYVERYVASVRSAEREHNMVAQPLEVLRNALILAFRESLNALASKDEEVAKNKKAYEAAIPALITAEFTKLGVPQSATPAQSPARNSAGKQKAGESILDTDEKLAAFDAVIKGSFDRHEAHPQKYPGVREGFQFVFHDNFIENLDRVRLSNGTGLPINIHPGTGGLDETKGNAPRNLLQAHLDSYFVAESTPGHLNTAELIVLGHHELAHLDIVNFEYRMNEEERALGENANKVGHRTWELWFEAGKPEGQRQEDFINGAGEFATKTNLNNELYKQFGKRTDVREIEKKLARLTAAKRQMISAQQQYLRVKEANLQELRDIIQNNQGAKHVCAVTSAGDNAPVKTSLEENKEAFRANGEVQVHVHAMAGKRGQFFALLDAEAQWIGEGMTPTEGEVNVAVVMPGQGTRCFPFTLRKYGIKALIPMLIRKDANSKWLSAGEASLYLWNHLTYHLKRLGFSGIAFKWADEPQLAATRLADLTRDNMNLSDVDIIRFGSEVNIGHLKKADLEKLNFLANNKEWLNADEHGNLTGWARRRPLDQLMQKLGVPDTENARALTHIGSPAFSNLFMETSREVFNGLNPAIIMAVDGYLMEGLTLSNADFEAELARDRDKKGLQTVVKLFRDNGSDFRAKCQELKQKIEQKRGHPLKIKVINFGPQEEMYWGDIGTLTVARKNLYLIAEHTPQGAFARKLACIDHAKPDEFGNIAVGNCLYPKDGSVKNSVLINTRIYGTPNIDSAVLVDSTLGNAAVGKESVVFGCTALNIKVGERAFAFYSIKEDLEVGDEGVHTSVPRNPNNIREGLDHWRAYTGLNSAAIEMAGMEEVKDWVNHEAATNPNFNRERWLKSPVDVGSDAYYNRRCFGNPTSFEAARTVAKQRNIEPAQIEEAIDITYRAPIEAKLAEMSARRAQEERAKAVGALDHIRPVIETQAGRFEASDHAGRALAAIKEWLTEERFAAFRPRLSELISRSATDEDAARELFEGFAYETPYYFTVDNEAMPEGIGPYRRNVITTAQIESERQQIEALVNNWEAARQLPADVERRLAALHGELIADTGRDITIAQYAQQHGISAIQAAAELRYLSSARRELLGATGVDRFAGIEMIDNPRGVNLGPVFRKFDVAAHGQQIAFRTYDMRGAVKSNFWYMPGLTKPKFFPAMMSDKLAFKAGLGGGTYAARDAEKIFGQGNVPQEKMWTIVCSGCRIYSEAIRDAYALGLQASGMKVVSVRHSEESIARVKAWLAEDVKTGRKTPQEAEAFLALAAQEFEGRGIVSTPQYYFLTRLLRYRYMAVGVARSQMHLDAVQRHFSWGAHGTGSHNPAEYNGEKQTIVRWVETPHGVVNYFLSINDAQMQSIKGQILDRSFNQVPISQMQQHEEMMSPAEVVYMHNQYIEARTRLGEDVWEYLMNRALAEEKPVVSGLSPSEQENRLREAGLDKLLLKTLREINWDAEWNAIHRQLGLPEGQFTTRPALCAKRPFEILERIAQATGREYAFAFDFMHGSAALSQDSYGDLGLRSRLLAIRANPNGTFEGGEPYPNLFEFTRYTVAELIARRIAGIARDEDGDRTILYTQNGKMIQGDVMMSVVAENRMREEARKPQEARKKLLFMGEVKFSSVLASHIKAVQQELAAAGTPVEAEVMLTPVGFGYIKDAMEQVMTAILRGEKRVMLFAGRPSPRVVEGKSVPIELDITNAHPVILGAELSGHQMDKFWFAEDELTAINLLKAWIEAIQSKLREEPNLLETNPEALYNTLDELISRVPVVAASPELRLGSEDEFSEEQAAAILAKAGPAAAKVVFSEKPVPPASEVAKNPMVCKELIVQGTRENFLTYMRDNFGLTEMPGETKVIAGDNCFVYKSEKPVTIDLRGSFQTLHNVKIYINRIDGMLVYFESDEGWGSFVIRKSNTQPEIISRIEGATPAMRDTIGVFMLSFFEQFQGTYLTRDVYVNSEVLPQMAYEKLSANLRTQVDTKIIGRLNTISELIAAKRLSSSIIAENLRASIHFKSGNEMREEHERLMGIAKALEERGVMPEETDLRAIIEGVLGAGLSTGIEQEVTHEYTSRIAGQVHGFGSERLYENMPQLIGRYLNIRVRDLLMKRQVRAAQTAAPTEEAAPAQTETAAKSAVVTGRKSAGAYYTSAGEPVPVPQGGRLQGYPAMQAQLSPANIVKLLTENRNPEAAIAALFEGRQESEYLPALAAFGNALNRHYANLTPAQRSAAWPVLEQFYSGVATRAWKTVENIETARGLQIMVGQTIAIQNLIENGFGWAENLELTSNPEEMLKSFDNNGKSRGPSYLKAPSGVKIAEREGEEGIYFRGAVGLEKRGREGENILPWASYAANNRNENEKFIAYTMLHVGRFHVTAFVNSRNPNSIERASTVLGHYQGNSLDVKRVTRGKMLQLLDIWSPQRELAETTAQVAREGEYILARPGTVDYMVPLTPIAVFNDFSVPVERQALITALYPNPVPTMEVTKGTLSDIGEAVASANAVPYLAIEVEGRTILVKTTPASSTGPNLRQIAHTNPSRFESYNATFAGLANVMTAPRVPEVVNNWLANLSLIKPEKAKEPERLDMLNMVNENVAGYVASMRRLNEIINAGEPLNVESTFNLGSKGYAWGEKVQESYTLGLEVEGEKTPAALEAVAARYGIPVNERVAEKVIAAGKIDVGTAYKLPVSVLSQWFGEEAEITAKILTSAMPLSVQLHTFAEMIIPLEKGKAWIGLKEGITARDLIEAAKAGRIQEVLREVELEAGVPIIVPAYVPHAYGNVKVYEVKAVTPEEDSRGTTSFFDRLKWLSPEMAPELASVGAASIEGMTEEQLRKLNPEKRWNKDVLTMTPEVLAKTTRTLEEAERRGALKATNIEALKLAPVLISAPEGRGEARLEIMGATERFVTLRYTVNENQSIEAHEILAGRLHTLTVMEGQAEVTTNQGVKFTLNSGEHRTLHPNIKSYTIKSLKGTTAVYTQVVPKEGLPATEIAVLAAQINNKAELATKLISGAPGAANSASVVLHSNGTTSTNLRLVVPGETTPLGNVSGKPVAIAAKTGHVTIVTIINNERTVVAELDQGEHAVISAPGPLFAKAEGGEARVARSEIGEEPATSKVVAALHKNLAELSGLKVYMLVDNRHLGPNATDENSRQHLQKYFRENMNIDLQVIPYNGVNGLSAAAEAWQSNSHEEGAALVLSGTAENFQNARNQANDQLKALLESAKKMALPDVDGLQGHQGFYFMREIAGAGTLLARISAKEIQEVAPIAGDLQMVMSAFRGGQSVNIRDLLYMMPFNEVKELLAAELKGPEGGAMDVYSALVRLVQRLLITLPIKPSDASEEYRHKREVLWSV